MRRSVAVINACTVMVAVPVSSQAIVTGSADDAAIDSSQPLGKS